MSWGELLQDNRGLHVTRCDAMQRDELEIPLNTLEGQRLLGARDMIAEEAFAEERAWRN